MATVKISALPNASAVSQSDELPVNVSSTTSRVTVGEFLAAIDATTLNGLVLAEQGSAPAAVANEVQLYAKDSGGVSALFARADDGTETQLTPQDTSAAVWSVEQAGSAPTATTDVVKFYAVATGGRAEPFVFLEDSEDIPLTRCTVRSITASTFTFDNKDETIFASTASNAITGTLPTPANHTGRMFLVWKTNTGTNKITLARAASESINGVAASYDLPGSETAAIGVWHIICDGTNWYVSGGAV
jgi:hypothetical protein